MSSRMITKIENSMAISTLEDFVHESNFKFRIDAFGDYANDKTILGFNGDCIAFKNLDTIETIHLQREENTFCLGIIPYEMAETFLPIKLNGTKSGYYFMNQDYLIFDKISGDITYNGHPEFYKQIEAKVSIANEPCPPKVAQTKIAKSKSNAIDKIKMRTLIHDDDFAIPKAQYQQMIGKAKDHIKAGDIFQIVLSNRYETPYNQPSDRLYKQTMNQSTMPYQLHLKLPDGDAIINSPELLVKADQDKVYTHPIAGTRPLKKDGYDLLRQQELQSDEKENAEHLMLVDLGRNDLQKISVPGSVHLTQYKKVKAFDTVYHMVSQVIGDRNYERLLDPIRATFPAGTVSGAPKLMAMSLIRDMENCQRGYYSGATFLIDESDRLEACINLRSIFVENGQAKVQAGSGIVYDSKSDDEQQEVMNKCYGQLIHVKGGSHVAGY